MTEFDKIKKKLRNLRQNKNLSDSEIDSLAREQLNKKEIMDKLIFCVDDKEKKFAYDLLNRYLLNSSITNEADKDNLRILIDNEILAERIKEMLKIEYEKANKAIPEEMLSQLRELNKQILDMKDRLGLTNQNKEKSSALEAFEELKQKTLRYFFERGAENVAKCPYCNRLFRILMKLDDKIITKFPFFRGTTLYNKEMFSWYHKKIITKEQLAAALEVSVQYIDFIYEKLFLKEIKNDK